jgi:polysaccharide deacetylase family protein (PEP-CTERM system associated)
MASIVNAFTVDVEDYFHVSAFANCVQYEDWEQYELRVEQNTRRLLRLLERHNVRATFFVLGWVAETCPQLVKDISAAGHELGNHSYAHRLVYDLSPDAFRADLRRCNEAIASAVGERVRSFRAPSFSITNDSLWALDVLWEEGFRYDSSIFPIRHDRYGIPGAPTRPHAVRGRTANDQLWEFPPAVHRWLRRINVPVAGGGYFRLLPYRLTCRYLARINGRDGLPFMFYIHPWEIDPDQPRLPAPPRSRFRHYQNLATTERKLERLLGRFRFGPLTEALAPIQAEAAA